MDNVVFRIHCVFQQLTRYATTVFTPKLIDLLEVITEINDDLYHARDPSQTIQKAHDILNKLTE